MSFRKIYIVCMLYVMLSSMCYAIPQLLVLTDKNEIEYGRPVRVEIVGIELKENLSTINLASLDSDFVIISDYSAHRTRDTRWPNQTVQILQFKLYSRKTGRVTIPALSVGNNQSIEKHINVIPGNTQLRDISISPKVPYVREQFIIKISIQSDNSNARISIKEPKINPDFEVIPQEFKRKKIDKNTYLLEIGLSVTPLHAGEQMLQLPPVEYSVEGVLRKLFYFQPQILHIRQLPAYLPPTIPIGHVSVITSVSKNRIYTTESLYYWTIQITANTNNTYRLPAVLRQLKSNSAIQYFPAETTRRTFITQGKILSEVKHVVPFKILSSGAFQLPQLQFQYFEPDTGKILNTFYYTPDRYALSLFWMTLISFILIILIILLIKKCYLLWTQWKLSIERLLQAKNILKNAVGVNEIRNSIQLISAAENWPVNITLSQWQKHWSDKYITNRRFIELMSEISDLFYNNKIDISCSELSAELHSIINTKKRIRKFNF